MIEEHQGNVSSVRAMVLKPIWTNLGKIEICWGGLKKLLAGKRVVSPGSGLLRSSKGCLNVSSMIDDPRRSYYD